jgi:hypothetical protein
MEDGFQIEQRWIDLPGQVQVDLISDHGYGCAVPRKHDAEAGVKALRTAFYNNEIEIDPSCRFLITTLRSGIYNDKRTDFERTRELGHMDAISAAIYGYRMRDEENPYPANYGITPYITVGNLTQEGSELDKLFPEVM